MGFRPRTTEFYLPILMGLSTGLRRGEILGVRWSDINICDRTLTVNQSLEQTRGGGLRFKSPKSKRGRRRISIPVLLVDALEPHRHEQNKQKAKFGPDYQDHGLVVCLADGAPWPSDSFSGSYVYFAGKIGAGGVRFHDLRHTHASQLLRQGTPVKTVSQRLGHSTAAITLNVYGHVLSGDDERATDEFDRILKLEFDKRPNQKAN
jgi:integrase